MKMIIIFIIILIIFCLMVPVSAKHRRLEKDYQKEWCSQHQGQVEVRLPDGTRCDCIATIDGVDYVIEFDFGNKWPEAIGQSLYYAVQTRKTPGIVLILENLKDYKYFIRLNTTIQYHKLKLRTWLIENYDGAPRASVTPTPKPTSSQYSCTPRKTCKQMTSCEEAYYHLKECGNKRLDRDKDGVPCESICGGG